MQDKYEYLRKLGDKRGNIIHILYLYSYAGQYASASVKTSKRITYTVYRLVCTVSLTFCYKDSRGKRGEAFLASRNSVGN
jgi:hypothetical protein